jgi:hypothetical protein
MNAELCQHALCDRHVKLTHDADDCSPVEWGYRDAQQEETDGYFDRAYRNEVNGLCDEVEFVCL